MLFIAHPHTRMISGSFLGERV